jgi:hypothetical protein
VAVVAVYDACVLYPSPLRDLLVRLALEALVVARWSDRILDEVFRNLRRDQPDLDPARLDVTRRRMNDAVLDAVASRNPATPARVGPLPDPNDVYVVATPLDAGAGVIVTFKLRDFPAEVLDPLGLTALRPDAFVAERIDAERDPLTAVVRAQAADLRNPPRTVAGVLDAPTRCGLAGFASRIRSGR